MIDLSTELAACKAEVEGLRIDLARRDGELAASQAMIAELTRRLEELHESKSWTVTAPLRGLDDLLHGRWGRQVETSPGTTVTPGFNWGGLARLTPVSDVWGTDRGVPVDRHYIELFLNAHRSDIRGRVLEVKDPHYAMSIGGTQVAAIDVLDIDPTNQRANVVADLSALGVDHGPRYDCFILTQTLHIIYDIRSALRNALRLVLPGGVLLCTIPALSRVNYENGGLDNGDYWRLTAAAIRRLFSEFCDPDALSVRTYGNVRVCTAFLYGLAAGELDAATLAHHDPWFPLIHCVRAVRSSDADR